MGMSDAIWEATDGMITMIIRAEWVDNKGTRAILIPLLDGLHEFTVARFQPGLDVPPGMDPPERADLASDVGRWIARAVVQTGRSNREDDLMAILEDWVRSKLGKVPTEGLIAAARAEN